MAKKVPENSGGSCDYYKTDIHHPWDEDKDPYEAECGEIAEALEMTTFESNIFKEVWRKAAERQGKLKAGNSQLRSAEKIKFFGDRMLIAEER